MKKYIPALVICLFLSIHLVTAQVVLFGEDFETSPVTSIVNGYTGVLPDGPPPCSQASRGTTVDFNSTSIDFQNSQNPGYFMGANPESPCGGYYNANLESDTLDFSGYDSLVFKCRYFKSTTLGWGPSALIITFDNLSDTYTIETEFTTTDNWDSIEVVLPATMISPNVVILINMGGGEGAALDDIFITGYTTPFYFPPPQNFQFSYDYISMGDWGICEGTIAYGPDYCSYFSWNTPDTSLTTATLDHYVLYYYDYDISDTTVVTTTSDTSYEITQGFIGEMWVTAVYTGPDGESDSSNVIVNSDLPIGISEASQARQPVVFYQAESGVLMFENSDLISSFSIHDITGKSMKNGENPGGQISTKTLSPGIYIIRIEGTDKQSIKHRFLITK
ncbi:MAG: T9SS type A sorting domain-containing protein [Bacteroidota bacterium]